MGITHLRKLEDAEYLRTSKSGDGPAQRTLVEVTYRGRAALESYRAVLKELLGEL